MRIVILLFNAQFNHSTNERRGSKTRRQENNHSKHTRTRMRLSTSSGGVVMLVVASIVLSI